MKQKEPTKAVIYARFSPRPDAETSESVETQIEQCRDFCAKNNYAVVSVHSDKALSGKTIDRPGLWDAVQALKKGYTLIVYKLDRLARDVFLSYDIERQVESRKAKIVSVTGEGTWGDTPEDALIRGILAVLAEYMGKAIAARTKATMLRHQANGRIMCDPKRLPYGWRIDPENSKRMLPDSYEIEIMADIVAYAEEGQSFRQIAQTLTVEGETPRNVTTSIDGESVTVSGVWNHSKVRRIYLSATRCE